MRQFLLLLGISLLCLSAYAQQAPAIKANYRQAARFSPKKVEKLVFSTAVDPHWLKQSDRFWYTYETPNGKNWYIVDPAAKTKKLLFDNAFLAAELTKIVKDPMDAQHLNIDSLRFVKDENWIQFEVLSTQEIEVKDTTAKKGAPPKKERKKYFFEYNINTRQLVELTGFKKPKRNPRWASVSPDGQTILFSKKYNLYWMDRANYEKALINEDDSTIVEHQLTTDGIEHFEYGNSGNENNVEKEKNRNKRKPVFAFWSPDSKNFALNRSDNRAVKELWVINSVAEPRPTIETYKYHMPGEKESAVAHLLVFNIANKTRKELEVKQFKDQVIGLWPQPQPVNTRDDDYRPLVWLGTNDKFYFNRTSRDLKRIDVCEVNITTGTVKPIVEERMNTYVELRRPGLVNDGNELIHWSERDGWAHFYLYDGNGRLKNQITSGAFHCEDIVGIDEARRVLYFSANGREPNEDPYYQHLYRVNFDGSDLRLLNAGEFEHDMSMNDNERYFVNTSSRVNTAPRSALYSTDGRKIMDLESTDLSSLFSAGYRFPDLFKV
ncbi:MAG TPA: DPP IV N-terminal domain-containing protein, partial [Flavisolibacter sp.]